ncbi:MAG: dihydrodipicolinate synthase family protein [Pirellulaceae bacterium]
MDSPRLTGLVAATYTPLTEDGSVNVQLVKPLVEYLLAQKIQGLYVCGSTGEGMSLSSDERKQVAEAYVHATEGRVPVIVQVGHNSLVEARSLAAHAQEIGADTISATCPSYFKVASTDSLVACMAEIAAAAPELPFYYYHIPLLTGSAIDMASFLGLASERIPSLVGLKYTDTKLFEFQECINFRNAAHRSMDILWGCDEMLLGALATGARGAIGSTYNIAAPLYSRLIDAFSSGDVAKARELQALSIQMIRTIGKYPFHPAMKAILSMRGFEVGGCRLPQGGLSDEEVKGLRADLEAIGFFEWSHDDARPSEGSPNA